VTHEELPADFNNSPLSDSDRSTSTDNSMRTTRGEQLELKRLRRELENAEKQNEALKATNRKQGTDINNAKTNEKKASDARQVLKNQQATAKEEAKKLRIEVADLKDQLSRAESKLPKLEREKEVALKAKTTFQDQVKELKSASKDDAARMGLINDRNEELRKERDTARARIEALEARLYSEPPVQHQQPMHPQQPMMQPLVQPVERDTASWDTARARNEELSKERDAARARIEALEARLYSEPPVQHQQPMQPQQPMMQQPMMQPQQPMMQPQQPMMQQQQPMMMQQQPMMMQQHQPMMQPQQPVMHQQQPMMQGQQQQPQHLYWK
jgi:chromosome segregation ATPase